VVRDRLRGYRSHPGRHILLVEVIHRTRPIVPTAKAPAGEPAPPAGEDRQPAVMVWPEFCEPEQGRRTETSAHIVKIADDPATLAEELGNWEKCRPVGLTHDSVLMHLRAGPCDADGNLVSILYEDAHHVIGAGQVMSLEEAVSDCCVWGSPTVASLEL